MCTCRFKILMDLQGSDALFPKAAYYADPKPHQMEEVHALYELGALTIQDAPHHPGMMHMEITAKGNAFIERAIVAASESLNFKLEEPLVTAPLDELTPERVAEFKQLYAADKAKFDEYVKNGGNPNVGNTAGLSNIPDFIPHMGKAGEA